jgi:DNA replication protein DnaC
MNLQQRMEKIHTSIKTRSIETPVANILPYDEMRLRLIKEDAVRIRSTQIEQCIEKLPPIFRDKTFDDFNVDYPEQMAIKSIAMRYAHTFQERQQSGTNLLFCGSPGTGKTLLALILYQALVRDGFRVHYEPTLQFLRVLQEKNLQSAKEFSNQLNFYKHAQLLIIDEATCGRVKGGELLAWEKETLFALMNMRYSQGLCTLFISNKDKMDFAHLLSERIAGRVMQSSITLAFNWPSYRNK